jgi:hypothetical protein
MLTKTLLCAVYRAKGHIRVQVSRKIKGINAKGKVAYSTEAIGSIRLNESLIKDLAVIDENLTAIERVEMREYLYSADFAQTHFNEEVDNFERDILRVPRGFFEATYQLAIIAQTNGVAFNPHQVMIEALFNHVKTLELKLSEKIGYPLKILEQYQVKKDE